MEESLGLVDRFIAYIKTVRHLSDYTVGFYAFNLEQLRAFLEDGKQQKGDGLLISASEELIKGFVTSLTGLGYKPATKAQKLATVRTFYGWMVKTEIIIQDPTEKILHVRRPVLPVKTLSEEQLAALIAAPGRNFFGTRDQACILLMSSLGTSISELVRINLEDVDFDRNTLRVTGKNQRLLDLDPRTLKVLCEYIQYRQQSSFVATNSLLINKHGTRIGGRSVRRMLIRRSREAGILMRISPSTLRHTCARHLLLKGLSRQEVRKNFGYKSHDTLRRLHDAFQPVAVAS